MASIDGIQRPADSEVRLGKAGRPVRRRVAPKQPVAKKVRTQKTAPTREPQYTEIKVQQRKQTLYIFVAVAFLGVIGLWYLGVQRTFSESGTDGGFFSGIIAQIQNVFSGVGEDLKDITVNADTITNSEVERLEAEVFPDIPTLND
ncbi:MAG: hypothetical protein WCV86_01815 [Patescibacteria group bacterium]